MSADALDLGRAAFDCRRWNRARNRLSDAGRIRPLDPDDLARFATAAYLIGDSQESAEVWTRARQDLVKVGDAVAPSGYRDAAGRSADREAHRSTQWRFTERAD